MRSAEPVNANSSLNQVLVTPFFGSVRIANEELNLASDAPAAGVEQPEWLSRLLTSRSPAVDLALSPRLRSESLDHERRATGAQTEIELRAERRRR
ncbi:unnamed protein product [Boreogadus saida]